MKWIKWFCVAAVLCGTALLGRAQAQEVNGVVNFDLKCTVQGNNTFTNLDIDSSALLELIAADQNLKLPARPRLWLSGSFFAVINPDNSVFAQVDTNLLNISYTTLLVKSKTTQTAKQYASTVNSKPVATISYNGATIAFNFTFTGDFGETNTAASSKAASNPASYASGFSGIGLGAGACGSQNMVVTGTLKTAESYHYMTETSTGPGTGGDGVVTISVNAPGNDGGGTSGSFGLNLINTLYYGTSGIDLGGGVVVISISAPGPYGPINGVTSGSP